MNDETKVEQIRQMMGDGTLQDGVHYGRHGEPGRQRNVLYKAGSERLLAHFNIISTPKVTETVDPGGQLVYRVECHGTQLGVLRGIGIGQCSTGEDEWGWRPAICQEEFDDIDPGHRRKRHYLDNGVAKFELQIRTNPADRANQALKMAKKRAQVDLALTALACSELFTQDLEETTPAAIAKPEPALQVKTTADADDSLDLVSTQKLRMVRNRLGKAGKQEADLCAHLVLPNLAYLPAGKVNAALAWIAGNV